jgi:hypothetical protein
MEDLQLSELTEEKLWRCGKAELIQILLLLLRQNGQLKEETTLLKERLNEEPRSLLPGIVVLLYNTEYIYSRVWFNTPSNLRFALAAAHIRQYLQRFGIKPKNPLTGSRGRV